MCFSSLRSIVVEFAAETHCRLSVFGRWPYKLLRLVVPGLLTASQRNIICREFFAIDECCLDQYSSLRLRKWAQRPSGLTSPAVLGLLRAWGEKGKIIIAHVERMHRANNDAFHPAKGCRVTAEAGVTMALLRAKMKSHLKRGRDDFTKCKSMRQYAERFGLQVRAKAGKRKAKWSLFPRNLTGNERVAYQNSQSALARVLRRGSSGSWTRAQEKQARHQWGLEYDQLSDEGLASFRTGRMRPRLLADADADIDRAPAATPASDVL